MITQTVNYRIDRKYQDPSPDGAKWFLMLSPQPINGQPFYGGGQIVVPVSDVEQDQYVAGASVEVSSQITPL